MALYKTGGSSFKDRAANQFNGAMKAMGGMTRENQTTEYKPGDAPATRILGQGVGLIGTANQLDNLLDRGMQGINWVRDKFSAPDPAQAAIQANSGAQALQQTQAGAGVQMNTGQQATGALPETAPEPVNMPDFIGAPQSSLPFQGLNGAAQMPANLN